ncbi:ATP-binding protein [Rhodococcus sp. D2-41]|uniref:ATP-binding protein n=1 Tax=Speluncibacter jeojiensis TaxID=2710754 RepID=UPI00240FC361|nr:ATP-binding protein [Rhodococcus sp. D2-41]MDG3011719.1 ATP-binding protein [Rhodococcus sp. D2-41]
MGGVDASAGFAYQHAQAVHRLLDLAELHDGDYLRVEAANDVVDVEIFATDDRLVHAAQYKIRDRRYTWGEAELVDELARWSALAVACPDAQYEFVTDGRLGPTGRKVQAALEAVRAGQNTALAELAQSRQASLDPVQCARAWIVADTPGFDQLLANAIDRVIALLPTVSGQLEAEERGTQLVHELLRIVVQRSGDLDPEARVITKTELNVLLSSRSEYVASESWSTDLKNEFIQALRQETPEGVELRCEATGTGAQVGDSPSNRACSLADIIGAALIPLLSGPSGSGKSTVIRRAQIIAARHQKIVIVVDAEAYIPKRLGSLVAQAINTSRFLGAYSTTGLSALRDPEVTVIIDGVSEIPPEERSALKNELRQLLASDARASLVLAGRDSTILQSMLPRHSPTHPMMVERLCRAQRLEILSTASHGALSPDIERQITARVEHALKGAADNPQLFAVGAALIASGYKFNNPASMYRQHVHSRAQDCGYSNITVLEVGLGVAFAALADSGRRYCDSFEWTEQLNSAVRALRDDGHDITTSDLREFGFESGFVHRSGGDLVRAVHDSFADYFAAVAHARGVARIPRKLKSRDTARVRFLIELAGLTRSLSIQISSDLPFLIPEAAEREDLQPEEAWYETTKAILSNVWPSATEAPCVAFWNAADSCFVTVNGNSSGWLGECTYSEVATDAYTFEAANGPLSVAARIWRHKLHIELDRARQGTASVPRTHEETVTALENFSDALASASHKLTREIAPPGQTEVLAGAVGPCRIEFALDSNRDAADQRNRGVLFRYVNDQDHSHSAVQEMELNPDGTWTGQGCVDSFLDEDPSHRASTMTIQSVNRLTNRIWL